MRRACRMHDKYPGVLCMATVMDDAATVIDDAASA